MSVEPVTPQPPRPVPRPLLAQRWSDVTFLHWPSPPAVVAPFLPAGTRPDTLDGVTYIGLVCFHMVQRGLPAGPGLPYSSAFCETNVRLYSVDNQGRRGVVFLALHAARLLPVLFARTFLRIPYLWSAMRLAREGDQLTYTCRQRFPTGRGVRSRLVVQAGASISAPTTLEHFLTARWGLHVRWYGRTLYLPTIHPQWPLRYARLLDLDDQLVAATGLAAPDGPPVSVLYSPGVPAHFGRPLPLP